MQDLYRVEVDNTFQGLSDSEDSSSDERVTKVAATGSPKETAAPRAAVPHTQTTAGRPATANDTRTGPSGYTSDNRVSRGHGGRGGDNWDSPGGYDGEQNAGSSRATRDRGGRGGGRGGGPPQNQRTASDEDGLPGEGRERHWQNDRPRRGARPSGQTRHRDFDRHVSGTNRGRGMKKSGGGAHNWGNQGDDMDGDANPMTPGVSMEIRRDMNTWGNDLNGEGDEGAVSGGLVNGSNELTNKQQNEGREDNDEQQREKSQKTPTMDYDEYLKVHAAKRANLPTLPAAKGFTATQRSDLEKDGYTLHVKEVDPDSKSAFNVTSGMHGGVEYYIRHRPADGIEAEFFQGQSGRGGRGGRGGGRYRGGRGGGYGGGDRSYDDARKDSPQAIEARKLNFQDVQAFPSLN